MTQFDMLDLILNKKLIYGCFSNIKDVTIAFEEDIETGEHHFIFNIDLDTNDTEKVFLEYNKLIELQIDFFNTNTLFLMRNSLNLIGEENE